MNTLPIRLPFLCAMMVMLLFLAIGWMLGQPTPAGAQATPTSAAPTSSLCVVTPGLSEGFESNTLGKFASVVATCVPGGCGWSTVNDATHSGSRAAFSPDQSDVTDEQLTLVNAIAIPASGVTAATLSFWHRYTFEGPSGNFDGGVLETSINGGASWVDAATLISSGGYGGTISPSFFNPLAARPAWVKTSPGYPAFYKTTVNLLSFAGKNVLFRFRQGDDTSVGSLGWWIDDVQVTINGCFQQLAPIIMKNAGSLATPNTSDNPVLAWLESLWRTMVGWLQPPSTIASAQ